MLYFWFTFLVYYKLVANAHDYAPCIDDENMLSSFPKDTRQWRNSQFLLPSYQSCADLVKVKGCNWKDDRSVYLRPWKQACPQSCNLCKESSTLWRTPQPVEMLDNISASLDLGQRCAIDRVAVSSIEDQEKVYQKYIQKGIPVIVNGLLETPSKWKLSTYIEKATNSTLLEAMSGTAEESDKEEMDVVNFIQQEYYRVQLLGYNQYGNLNEYPEHSPSIRRSLEKSYIKPSIVMGSNSATEKKTSMKNENINKQNYDLLRETCGDFLPEWSHHWILIAGQGTSTAWHVDQFNTSAWNTVLQGKKRWSLAPPSLHPPSMSINAMNDFDLLLAKQKNMKTFDYFEDDENENGWGNEMPWSFARSRYAKVHTEYFEGVDKKVKDDTDTKDVPIECSLLKGETIFVPSGWWHTVYNVEASIAITENVMTRTNFMNVLTELMARPRGTIPWKCAKRLVDTFPDYVTSEWLQRFGLKWRKMPLKWRSRIKTKKKQIAKKKGEEREKMRERKDDNEL
jgi:hypothetical protein